MTVSPVWLVLAVDEDKVTPGVLGFLVVAALGVATYLLIRSMNRQMRNIQVPRDEAEPDPDPEPEQTGESRPNGG